MAARKKVSTPLVGVILGSKSDWETMQHASAALKELDVPHECAVVSAHRTPLKLVERVIEDARECGVARIVLHTLPSMHAAHTLYTELGFRPCEPYAPQPVEGAVFLAHDVEPMPRRA